MKFSIQMCRGNILDIINLADNNNLIIESIEQRLINDDISNIKVAFSGNSNIYDIDKFVSDIKNCNSLNSCETI